MSDIKKIIKSLKESRLLIKDVSETIRHEEKEQKGKFIGMLLSSLLGSALTGRGAIRGDEGTTRADENF